MRSVFPNGDTAVMALDDGEAAADSDSPYAPSAREGSERTDVTSRTVTGPLVTPKIHRFACLAQGAGTGHGQILPLDKTPDATQGCAEGDCG
jgi:hypothetical protein